MIETIALTAAITGLLTFWRAAFSKVRQAWTWATWLERIGLVLMLVPIPGPIDELIGVTILLRIHRRRQAAK